MGFILGGLDTEGYDRSYSDRELVRRIVGYFRPEWKRMSLVAAMILLNSGFNTLRPLLITRGIDMLATDPTPRAIILLSLAVMLLGVLAWTFNFWRVRASVRAVGNVVLRLRQDVFKTVTEHDMSFYDENASGKIVSRVTSDTEDFSQVVTLVTDLMSQILLVIILLFVLFFINWKLTLVVLSTGPFMILLSLALRKTARSVSLRAKQARAVVNANVQESVSGIAVAKSFRQEQALYDEFKGINQETYRIGLKRGIVMNNIFPALDVMSAIATALIVYAGGATVINSNISVGTWYLFIQALGLFLFPLTSIASFWSQFQDGLSASERVFALIDAEPRVIQDDNQPVGKLQGKVEFCELCFAYKPGEDVLCDFSLTIHPGETLAFVGHTGAGKSSLARLVARFYEFQDGQLLIDDRDIRTFDLTQYRRQIGGPDTCSERPDGPIGR